MYGCNAQPRSTAYLQGEKFRPAPPCPFSCLAPDLLSDLFSAPSRTSPTFAAKKDMRSSLLSFETSANRNARSPPSARHPRKVTDTAEAS
ncbi:hypothetical protein B484DRAFT_442310 [Ochromonadaceae sp. CCMP2298]|nr:hypothetical protein B484DRAFT_442310 [Ochromonadaceae sp. CCMP2298]